jgi:hypothetical protein
MVMYGMVVVEESVVDGDDARCDDDDATSNFQ